MGILCDKGDVRNLEELAFKVVQDKTVRRIEQKEKHFWIIHNVRIIWNKQFCQIWVTPFGIIQFKQSGIKYIVLGS